MYGFCVPKKKNKNGHSTLVDRISALAFYEIIFEFILRDGQIDKYIWLDIKKIASKISRSISLMIFIICSIFNWSVCYVLQSKQINIHVTDSNKGHQKKVKFHLDVSSNFYRI